MYLKVINLKGFKSFPDRTRLTFSPGVSVIVGPNGSGKSNITDAVLWALGEQSPSAIRGHQMRDVIFAEDHSQVRTGAGPQVMASLRNLVISILRLMRCRGGASAPRDPRLMLGVLTPST